MTTYEFDWDQFKPEWVREREERQRLAEAEAQKRKAEEEAWRQRVEAAASDELTAVKAWEELLDPWFTFEHEVTGVHYTGRRVRMDALLHPRFEWKAGGRRPLGFEVKRPFAKEAEAIGQALDYAASRWNSDIVRGEQLDVFVAAYAPGYANDNCPQYHGVEQLLGRLGVVLFDYTPYDGLVLRVSGNIAWTHERGPCSINWGARRKFGSR